ncbi:MAG: hypothetical protein H6581_31330 [Bacteroidia bacterium]|nr:hypothetical protein [Bacteroidia bacterium]
MLRRITSLLLIIGFCAVGLRAQTYGLGDQDDNYIDKVNYDYANQWYNPAQIYVKLRLWEDGIYQVDAADLVNAGIDTTFINPDNYHLLYRGDEIPIHVEKAGSQLNFIQFYGKRNDGLMDTVFYRDPTKGGINSPEIQPNRFFSLWSDTTAYWLTWDNKPGQRINTYSNTNYGAFNAEPYFRFEAFFEYALASGNFNLGGGSQYDIYQILNSDYVTGEGYAGGPFSPGAPHNKKVNTPYHYSASGNPSRWKARLTGKSTWQHITEIFIQNTSVVKDTNYGVFIKTYEGNYLPALPASPKFVFEASGTQNNNTDNCRTIWFSMEYDRSPNMGGAPTIKVYSWNKPNDAFLQLSNTSIAGTGVVWDYENDLRILATGGSGVVRAVIPGSTNERKLFVSTDNGIKKPLVVVNHSLSNLSDPGAGAEFIIITHRRLTNSALKYATYRDTNTVNQLKSKVVFVDQIWDEFGYGTISPWAIKRFCKYAIDHYTTAPQFFFLWGKGKYMTRGVDNNLVPTYGYPACDYEYVSNFDIYKTDIVPQVPIGRVNIVNDIEGENYLEKVMKQEHTPWESWMKEGIFLGGGDDSLEQKPIYNYLKGYIKTFEGNPLGGNASYFQKYNTGLITNSSKTVTTKISEGVGLIQFFGHSSANIYDVDIQLPFNYGNWFKFPMMIAFGCFGGDFTVDGKSFGEKFVIEKDRGSIGYLGNSTAGYLSPLGDYGNRLYPRIFNTEFGKPIGVQINLAIKEYLSFWNDQLHRNHAKQLNLQGDPSVILYNPKKPDLEITQTGVYFTPTDFSASDDSFKIHVITHNLGLSTQDSFYMSITQQTPQGLLAHPPKKYGPISLVDTLEYTIYNTIGPAMAGVNVFSVFVDSDSILDEYNEDNNLITFPYLIPGNIPAILSPYDFAIIDSNHVVLKAASYVISKAREIRYIFEVDTVPEFKSPLYSSSGAVMGTSFLAEWEVPFALQDSQVYYWRVRMADVLPAAWANASFKYIPNRVGWAQSRPPQFFKDPTEKITMDKIQRQWKFDQFSWELHAFTSPGGTGNYRLNNGVFKSSDASISPCVLWTSFDQYTLEPNYKSTINSGTLGDWTMVAMPGSPQALIDAILDTKDGDYMLMVSHNDPNVPAWPQSVFNALSLIGVSNAIQNLQVGDAFILFGRKGYPGSAIEILAPNLTDPNTGNPTLDLITEMTSTYDRGLVQSTTIGPSINWKDLVWNWGTIDAQNMEDTRVDVYANNPLTGDSLIYSGIDPGSYPLNALNAKTYPYLRLEANAVDTIQRTAPQLEHWHVVFDAAPDAVIDPITNYAFHADTIDEGEPVNLKLHLFNVTKIAFTDSMLIRFTIERADRSTAVVGEKRYPVLGSEGAYDFEFEFSTADLNLDGDVRLTVEVNPDYDQPEMHFFNNLYTFTFHVLGDHINPILDVTFDGKHIMDGDIVSPNPEIKIQVNDENKYLVVSDTGYVVNFGKGTNPFSLDRIFIDGNPQMERVPAQLPDNKAQLFYRPGTLENGEYMLTVQGFDQKGNASGKKDYQIRFEVVNESTLSNVLNYPNPFSTSTRFVYTLTGAKIPDQFDVHIYTITGKLVKVIDLLQEGGVHIGYNITDYSWDGRDEYGDLLANGVYIYKIVAKYQGESFKLREEGIESLFKNGFGKLTIMR